jgi:hypothetical protein
MGTTPATGEPSSQPHPSRELAERPAKGTPEYDLWLAAIDVAAAAPLNRAATVSHTLIYWGYIEKLRRCLDELGVDWRSVKEAG